MRGESGHSLLYIVLFIPVLVGVTALSFDLSTINLTEETIQNDIDQLTLDAAHYLPNTELTRERILREVQRLPVSEPTVNFDSTASRVSLSVEIDQHRLLLPKILGSFGTTHKGEEKLLRSEAELLPVDLVVILSDGVEERPWKEASYTVSWPQESQIGAATRVFNGCIDDPEKRYSNVAVQNIWNDSKEWITQSCFNPVFSRFKLAAMNLTGSVLAVGTNRASVIFTPGATGSGEVVRGLTLAESARQPGGFVSPKSVPLAAWIPYQDLEYELGDEACIAFAETENQLFGEYSLERLIKRPETQRGCKDPIADSMCGLPFAIGMFGRLNLNCLKRTSLAESIYWRSAKRPIGNFAAVPNIYAALSLALIEFERADQNRNIDLAIRGNLTNFPKRLIVILTSFLPELDSSDPSFENLSRLNIELNIGVVQRDDFSSPVIDSAVQHQRAMAWQTFLADRSLSSKLNQQVQIARNPRELTENVLPKFVSATRKVLLRR